MLKRMMKYAAKHGYDGISWTPGEQQAERYDLSKQVKELFYYPDTQRLIAYDHAETRIMNDVIPPKNCPTQSARKQHKSCSKRLHLESFSRGNGR